MRNDKMALLAEMELDLTPSLQRTKSRFQGIALRGVLTAAIVSAGILGAAPSASAATACNQPDFVNYSHLKWCGISPQEFRYKSSSWTAGTLCYKFDHYTIVCGYTNYQFVGVKYACNKYYVTAP